MNDIYSNPTGEPDEDNNIIMQLYNREQEELFIDGIDLATQFCNGLALHCGWWTDPATGQPKERNDGELIALMHSELSEALEGVRKSKMDNHLPHRKSVEVELADCIIRILDFAGARDLDIGGAMIEKLRYNAIRADHKLENRAKEDGKKF